MHDETGWLIEMRFGDGLLWWSGDFDGDHTRHRWSMPASGPSRITARMVNNAGLAVRFARREDAQRVLDGMLAARPSPLLYAASELYSVQEHMWPAPASKPANV